MHALSNALEVTSDAVVALKRAGLSVRDSLKIGEAYSITYDPALDGGTGGLMTATLLYDGRVISMSAKHQQTAANSILGESKPVDNPQPGLQYHRGGRLAQSLRASSFGSTQA